MAARCEAAALKNTLSNCIECIHVAVLRMLGLPPSFCCTYRSCLRSVQMRMTPMSSRSCSEFPAPAEALEKPEVRRTRGSPTPGFVCGCIPVSIFRIPPRNNELVSRAARNFDNTGKGWAAALSQPDTSPRCSGRQGWANVEFRPLVLTSYEWSFAFASKPRLGAFARNNREASSPSGGLTFGFTSP